MSFFEVVGLSVGFFLGLCGGLGGKVGGHHLLAFNAGIKFGQGRLSSKENVFCWANLFLFLFGKFLFAFYCLYSANLDFGVEVTLILAWK